jgi:hypothetical protein
VSTSLAITLSSQGCLRPAPPAPPLSAPSNRRSRCSQPRSCWGRALAPNSCWAEPSSWFRCSSYSTGQGRCRVKLEP